MSAQIVMDTGSPVTGSIITTLSTLVNLSNFSNTGVLGWRWVLKDKPVGSAVTIASPYVSTQALTPDVEGTYLVELTTYADAARTVLDDADVQAFAVRYEGGFAWRIPAAGETTQFNSTLGWKAELNTILDDLHGAVLKPTALKNAAYSAKFGDYVLVDLVTAVGNVTITPPSAVGKRGKRIGMMIVGSASGRQAIFDPAGAETVNGAATKVLSTDNAFAEFVSDNANWQIVG